MNGFEKRRREKKEAIMRTAMELFSAHGFERISMTEIAAKARVSKVSIYNFFDSKENLRRVIVKKSMDDSLDRLNTLSNSEDALIDKVAKYLGGHQLPLAFIDFFFDAIESDFELKEYFERFTTESKRIVSQLIKQGKETGIFSRDISDTAIETYIDMYMSYFTRNPKLWDLAERRPELVGEIKMLFLDGLIRHDSEIESEQR